MKSILLVLSLFISFNAYANNMQEKLKQELSKHNINANVISTEELSVIIDKFNQHVEKNGIKKNITEHEIKNLQQIYIYLKSQDIKDPDLRKVRDKTIYTIEKSKVFK